MANAEQFNYSTFYSTFDRKSIHNFVVYGERHSGTTWLTKLINGSFNIPLAYGFDHKHFFGCCDWSKLNDATNTLFIGIVRNIYGWTRGMIKIPYHLETKNIFDIKPWISSKPAEIICDRHWYTKKQYLDIFDMRYNKIYFLYYIMPYLVNNYIFIRYEDLIQNHKLFIYNISKLYNLSINLKYKYTADSSKLRFDPLPDKNYLAVINTNTIWTIENQIGYAKAESKQDKHFLI